MSATEKDQKQHFWFLKDKTQNQRLIILIMLMQIV